MNKIITEELFNLLKSYSDIPEIEVKELIRGSKIKEYKKGESFVESGEPANLVGFVHRGLFRAFALSAEGQMYIRNFCSQGYFVGSYASAIRGSAADMTIEAIENSLVLTLEYSFLSSFFKRSAQWQEFGRKIAENHYMERELKEYRLLANSALERYEFFINENPHLEGRVSQADIASYIGVAPESLSRALKKSKI